VIKDARPECPGLMQVKAEMATTTEYAGSIQILMREGAP
jgi:hypothetical protein